MNRLLRLFFKLLYNQFAWSYNFVSAVVSTGLWRSWVLAVLDEDLHPPILEIGFGTGSLINELSRQGVNFFGLDASIAMVRLAASGVKDLKKDNVLVNGYAQSIPFLSSYFNHVITTFPADFILEEATWREIYRILTPQGKVTWLPVAWITGTGALSRAASWLFKVTHQAPAQHSIVDLREFAMATQAGFYIEPEYKDLERSSILIIHAYKRNRQEEDDVRNSNRN